MARKKEKMRRPEVITKRKAPPRPPEAVRQEALDMLKQRFPQYGMVVDTTCTETSHGH
jgi:hypothetical protein